MARLIGLTVDKVDSQLPKAEKKADEVVIAEVPAKKPKTTQKA